MVQFWVKQNFQPILLPPSAHLLLPGEVFPHLLSVNNLVISTQHNSYMQSLQLLFPKHVLGPEKMSRERTRDIGIATREVPQFPFVGRAWCTVYKVKCDAGEVEEEWDRIDEECGGYQRGEEGVVEYVGGYNCAVGVGDEGQARYFEGREDARYGSTISITA